MKGLGYFSLVGLLLVGQGQPQDQCTGTEQVERTQRKLQEQLDRTKTELDSWQNQTLQFMQCPVTTKTCVSFEEVKQITDALLQQVKKQMQENLNELKADIQQLKNITLSSEEDGDSLGTLDNPATSCQHIARLYPNSLPGYKVIRTPDGETHISYCVLQAPCSGDTDGWMRLALVNMTNTMQNCPPGLRQINSPKRSCGRTLNRGGCSSVTFNSHSLAFNKVCGRVIGYHYGSPSGFYTPYSSGDSIDGPYLEGVSITHGQNPRKHVWSFANALEETADYDDGRHVCPCSNPRSTMQRYIPSFVGNDYYCDSGIHTGWKVGVYYDADPLWDGQGCESPSTCCSFNSPPWFYKELPQPANDNIELRICADQDAFVDEDSPVELIELYIQ